MRQTYDEHQHRIGEMVPVLVRPGQHRCLLLLVSHQEPPVEEVGDVFVGMKQLIRARDQRCL